MWVSATHCAMRGWLVNQLEVSFFGGDTQQGIIEVML